jgi:hypothetical protein
MLDLLVKGDYSGGIYNPMQDGIGSDSSTDTNNDTIWAGSGRDYISGGSGVNHIYCGNDLSTDIISVSGTGVDHIHGATSHDYISIPYAITACEQVGRNLHITLNSGKLVVLHDFMETEDQNNPVASDKGLPFLIDADGNILGYSIPEGGFVDTGTDIESTLPEDFGDEVPAIPQDLVPPAGSPGAGGADDDKIDTPLPWDAGVSREGGTGLWDIIAQRLRAILGKPGAGFGEAEITRSPLVLDLDGDGVETIDRSYGNIYFDHDGNGFSENSGWVNEDDGILVRDMNDNGTIDGGSELFGNETVLSNGLKADNGFEALKKLDSNNDNAFDADDNAWDQLRVWKDVNRNNEFKLAA